jgi:hypothetical protein
MILKSTSKVRHHGLVPAGFTGDASNSNSEHVCYIYQHVLRLRRASFGRACLRRPELWDTNPRLAERIEMRIKDAQRAHREAHGGEAEARQCLAQQPRDSARDEPY